MLGLKKELPELIEHARKDFDFGKVPGAVEYDARKIRKKASSAAFSPLAAAAVDTEDDETQASWKDYPPEKARRIFEWWKTRVGFFTYWPTALRLVVLVQRSSAFVERVFSQVKLIFEQTGLIGLEESIEARVLVRCNHPPSFGVLFLSLPLFPEAKLTQCLELSYLPG
jgi:hypothetical protein